MLSFFLLISLMGGLMSYMSLDPMKSSFFLILSMLLLMPCVSFGVNVWFSYFISLLFLSGIFVILVYFSSLSSFSKKNVNLSAVVLFLSFMSMLMLNYYQVKTLLNLNVFYYSLYWVILIYVILMLLIFMNFVSYFLNFSGALRKV
uniref:NADH dehydrogenase subunit 6 n=1 Tax=Cooperia oncophora TaxID=27828 RepID=A0A4P2SCL3_COOON|nr:NADH dehydrogenase subunit 6 [Cooperia oncophora]